MEGVVELEEEEDFTDEAEPLYENEYDGSNISMEDVFAAEEEEDEPERTSAERDARNNSRERADLVRKHQAQI